MQGNGTYFYADGSVYVGQWRNSMKSGRCDRAGRSAVHCASSRPL
jgi:hypothetical protein